MPHTFKTIGIMGRHRKEDISDTLLALIKVLKQKKIPIVIEEETASLLPTDAQNPTCSRDDLGNNCDLIIVVGGDGSLLNAARAAVDSKTPVLGINRGTLGFLTDIHPTELDTRLSQILDGEYVEEKRVMLEVSIEFQQKKLAQEIALNDAVLMPGDIPHMIEFSIIINDQFIYSQRADGLIVATPTGSTAYSLSAGGPILHPQLDVFTLVPMAPHTLSARPIVISGDSTIKIAIAETNEADPRLSCDGQVGMLAPSGSVITIRKKSKQLRLIHASDYNYFETLRKKLHWNT